MKETPPEISRAKLRGGETARHKRLKRLALLWAQANGYSACAAEVTLPRCRYRADLAAYRPERGTVGMTAIFECKQARADLRRDDCCTASTRERIESLRRRRAVLECCLRTHYPTLRTGESLFPEYDVYDFAAIGHRTYDRVIEQLNALENSLRARTKFECLTRCHVADLLYLVLPNELSQDIRGLPGWGVLVEDADGLTLFRKPARQHTTNDMRLQLLQRIAAAGTRQLNHKLEITFDRIQALRREMI